MKRNKVLISILVALFMVVTPFGSVCYAGSGDSETLTGMVNAEEAVEEEELTSNDSSASVQESEEDATPEVGEESEQKTDEDKTPNTADSLEQPEVINETPEDSTSEGNGKRLLANESPKNSGETFAGGDGTQNNPYQIETVEQLDLVRDNLSAHYILVNDIEFEDGAFSTEGPFYNGGKGWTPIGTSSEPFTGSFDGNGKTISGLKITADIMYAGLFGYINSANIANLAVKGEITVECASSEAYVGSVAGYKDGGNITGCTNLTNISSTLLSTTSSSIHYVGGIVGYNKGTLANCSNKQMVSCDNIYSYLGGIAGSSFATISNSTNDSSVNGKEYVGGIVGSGACSNCNNNGEINNSGNPSPKNAVSIYTGGITGNGNCSNCTNDGSVYASATYKPVEVGGISGSGTVSNSTNTGNVKGDNNSSAYGHIHVGGIVGQGVGSYCKNYGHIVGAGSGDSAYTYVGGIVGDGYSTATTYSSNSGRVELNTNRSYTYAGGIVGAHGNVEKCYNIGLIMGNTAGGISGLGRNIKDCYNAGIVKSNKGCAGGITGKINYKGALNTCYNIGNVQSTKGAADAGGLSGANDSGSVTNCFYLNRIDIGVAGDQYLGTSASLDQMKDQSLYDGFDFSTIWSINPDADYPLPIINGVAEVESQDSLPMSDSISGMTVVGLNPTYRFSGNPIEPSATIDGLVKDTDYKVAYSNNINAGVASITFTGIGNYSGTMTKQFRIVPIELPSVQLSGFEKEYCYTGEAIEPSATLGDLVLDTDYSLSYENNIDGGTATITATGIGNYTGSVSGTFTIYVPISISDMSFSGLDRSYSYTGKAIVPQIKIGDLVEGDDYTLSIENNINVGTATIKATGKKYYKDELVSTFEIEPADISEYEVGNLKETYVQTGGEITPKISIEGLVKGEDYTVAYSNNINIGVATITVKGIGNYTGGIVKHFSIVDEDISNKRAYIPSDTYEYTGSEIKPSVTIVGLVQDEDYTVSYSNNIDVGNADILVKGINTFAGEIHIPFTITKGSISDFEFNTDKDTYTFTGDSIVPTITILSASGNPLVEGDDYTVKMYSNINVGSALFVINGTGNYKGFLVGSFDIVPLSISGGTVSGVADKTYTGKAVTQTLALKVGGKSLKSGSDYSVTYKSNVNVGTATITIEGSGNYTGTITKTFKINMAANPLTVNGKTATLKFANVKKKTQNLVVSKVLTVTKNQGKVTYAKASGNGKISINKITGKVTIKKGLKKGTYSIKVKVTAAGNNNYNKITKTVTFKVKIR